MIRCLTFAELESLTCLGLTGFLSLHHTGVTLEEALGFEGGTEIRIELANSAGDGETEGLSLAGHTAAVEVDLDVILAHEIGDLEGLGDDILEGAEREILFVIALVDGDLAAAFLHVDSGNCGFSSSDCISDFHCYLISLMLINLGC